LCYPLHGFDLQRPARTIEWASTANPVEESMRKLNAVILGTLITIGCVVASPYVIRAQEKARIAWAALNPAASPMWVIQEKGLLKKLGVDAEIIDRKSVV